MYFVSVCDDAWTVLSGVKGTEREGRKYLPNAAQINRWLDGSVNLANDFQKAFVTEISPSNNSTCPEDVESAPCLEIGSSHAKSIKILFKISFRK